MGLFNKLKDEAQNLIQQHPDQASQAAEKAGQAADKATGGKYSDQIQSGMQTAQQRIGGQPSDQDGSQPQDMNQDPSMNQGQDPNAEDDDDQFGNDQNR